MKAYQKRVVAEKKALDKKLASLREFIGSNAFNDPCWAERERLRQQASAMNRYSAILESRIAAFKR
jgi:hypothetical protein